jgi:hypothetical protein
MTKRESVVVDFTMDERERRGREIYGRIGRVLYEDWDPFGLRGEAPSDEYDGYIGGVYRLLASGASCEKVAEHLAELERGPLGCSEGTAAQSGGDQEVVRTRRPRLAARNHPATPTDSTFSAEHSCHNPVPVPENLSSRIGGALVTPARSDS